MGNDICWYAAETDMAKQRQAALFLNIMLKKLNWNVSDKDCRETDVYKGFQNIWCFNLDAIDEHFIIKDREMLCYAITGNNDFYNKYGDTAIPKLKPRKFTGFTAHLEGRASYTHEYYKHWTPYFYAHWQFTMIFNNSPLPNSIEKQGELVTLERVAEPMRIISEDMYELLNNKDEKVVRMAVYRRGGNTRVGGQKDLFLILYLIRELFIPSLHVSDDYRYIHDLDKEIDDAGLKKPLSIPSQKWKAVNDILQKHLDLDFGLEDVTSEMYNHWGKFFV